MARAGSRYRFGPLERRGLIAGWRGGQIAALAACLAGAAVLVGGRPDLATLLGAAALAALGVAVAWWPIAGRTGEEWLPVLARWTLASRRPSTRAVVESGHRSGDGPPRHLGAVPFAGARRRAGAPRRPPPSPVWAGLSVVAANLPELGPTGVVVDRRARTYTAVIEVLGQNFALLGVADKQRRVGAWASLLASFARQHSLVHRLQWIAATIPDAAGEEAAHVDRRSPLPPDAPARRSYADLLRHTGGETRRREVLLTVTLRAAGAGGRAVRAAGGGERAALAVLGREVASLRRQLVAADIPVERVLDAPAVASVVRRCGRASPGGGPWSGPGPGPGAGRDSGEPQDGRGPDVHPDDDGWSALPWPWPLSVAAEWGSVRTDETWHATYWIAEWPRTDVDPEFLAPLLLGAERRSLSVVLEPVDPVRAVRRAERARTADIADAELRRRGGFLATARRHREAELATRREGELADGHAAYRFSGYVTVTVDDVQRLAAACEAAEQAASQCGLELRRLYGDQERALACTLPLGRGLS